MYAFGQSSDLNFPTPLDSNKLTGTIKARDIGDNRLTTHYFVFMGTQGDLFVNVVSNNLDADIDVFAADGMIPLTKMVVASDAQANETGRLIYLRKPERLILRVQGRTPNDLPATYQVSFGGSFAVVKGEKGVDAPVVDQGVSGEVAVNSVGTILPKKAEAAPRTDVPKPSEAVAERPEPDKAEVSEKKEAEVASKKTETAKAETPSKPRPRRERRAKVVVTESVEAKPPETPSAEKKAKEVKPKRESRRRKRPEPPKAETTPPVDPLANVKLVIVFKNGEKTEIGMPDLMKFTVDRGQLIVIRKNGSIERYSMVEVAKVTIE
ncbi:MAG: hypothetical protein LC113_13345 [Acidobacteria bacterium]|nr:hypothetical protein [Acidobacteriota bacterium]